MNLPTKVYIGTVWRPMRRDRSSCVAILRVAEKTGQEKHLLPGVHNGGFCKVTNVTEAVSDNFIEHAITSHHKSPYRESPEGFELITPTEFCALYIIYRTYETTMD